MTKRPLETGTEMNIKVNIKVTRYRNVRGITDVKGKINFILLRINVENAR